jgi:hypothetical protein
MKESLIEKHTIKRVKELGGFTRKVVYQGRKGSPDRWCFFPGGLLVIVELKATGESPDSQQAQEIADLREMGMNVHWTDSKQGVDEILRCYFL